MIDDRDYMREPEYGGSRWSSGFRLRWSWTIVLMAINLIVFILVEINKAYNPVGLANIAQYGALSNTGIAHGYVWQFLTYQFLHFGRTHFVMNMLGLFFLGRPVESIVGGKRFLGIYLVSGVIGGVFQVLLGLVFPNVFGLLPVVGASAGVCALLAAWATIEPNSELLLFFILPVKLKYCAWLGAVVAAFYVIVPAEPGIAHAAHLGGMAMGWFYVKYLMQSPALIGTAEPEAPRRAPTVKQPEEKTAEEFLESEVNPILDKISARGIQSLTARERAILEAARRKISRS